MKTHTTNYQDTFIEIADDCPVSHSEMPPMKGDAKTVARIQYDILNKNPYKYTSDDVIFQVYAERNDLAESELSKARDQFFSKGQPCMRASPLTKRYGWGVHNDGEGKIALFGVDSEEYEQFTSNKTVNTVKAMKSKK